MPNGRALLRFNHSEVDRWIGAIDPVIGINHQQPTLPWYNRLIMRAGLGEDGLLPFAVDVLEHANSAGSAMVRWVTGGRAGLFLLGCNNVGYSSAPNPGIDFMNIPIRVVEIKYIPSV